VVVIKWFEVVAQDLVNSRRSDDSYPARTDAK
jgi:hypothetical protein